MNDRTDRDEWRRESSLQALGRAMRGDDDFAPPSGSLLSLARTATPDWRRDAVERHEAVRAGREAAILPEEEAEETPPPFPVTAGAGAPPEAEPDPFPPIRPPEARTRADDAHQDEPPGAAADDRWKPLIDPMKVIGGVFRSKALIAAMTLLGALAGVAIALSTPKTYEAATELIIDPRDLKLTESDLTQTMIASDATLAIIENQMRVLTSGAVLNKVVDKLNLVRDPEFNGEGGSPGPLAIVRSLLSGKDKADGADDEVRRRALAVNNLAESIKVERGGRTFVITVGARTHNADKSALIANTMTDVFFETYGQIQSETAGRATDELTARLDELRKGVEVAERKVGEFKATHDLVDAQGRLISDDELLKLNDQLSVARARTLELNARAASTKSIDVDAVLGGGLPEEVNSNTMADLRAQYATLKQEADRAAVRLGPRHPERIALDAQLAGARERIAAELRRIGSSLQVELRRAVQLEQELSARLARLKVRSGDVGNDLVSLRELEREAAAKRSVYEAFLLRARETSERRDINTANVSVISKAFPPLEPSGPSRSLIALAGMLLGFAAGVGLGGMRGAYESLRETADERRAAPRASRRPPLEDRDPPPAAAAGPPLRTAGGTGPADARASASASASEDDQPSIEEIRASLREFREAVEELAASRAYRRRA